VASRDAKGARVLPALDVPSTVPVALMRRHHFSTTLTEIYTPSRPNERCLVDHLCVRGANALRVHREKVAYYEKEAADVSNKVDKRKRQCDGAVGGLGCGEF
jgi:hypothetical protein